MTHGKKQSFTEKFGTPRSKTRPVPAILPAQEWIPYHKAPEHAMIFNCNVCHTPRVFGRAFMIPEECTPLLICHNCQKSTTIVNAHTRHTFRGIVVGGGVRVPEALVIQ